jgi:hypothetical protein
MAIPLSLLNVPAKRVLAEIIRRGVESANNSAAAYADRVMRGDASSPCDPETVAATKIECKVLGDPAKNSVLIVVDGGRVRHVRGTAQKTTVDVVDHADSKDEEFRRLNEKMLETALQVYPYEYL